MEKLFIVFELLVSFVENLLIFGIITNIAGKKYVQPKQTVTVILFSLLLTGVVSFLNSFEIFSFLTIFIGFFLFILLSKFLASGTLLLRATACAVAFFFLHTIDYLTGFFTALILGSHTSINESFLSLSSPGITRIIYIILNKSIQVALFYSLSSLYCRIGNLSKKYLAAVLGITVTAYITMSILLNMIITDSLVVLQIAVILSWLFIMLCVVAAICSATISMRYQEQKKEAELIDLTNDLMTRNYQKLYDVQTKISQQVHDFTNHLKTIDRLIDNDKEAKQYVETLLQSPKQQVQQSQSGNRVIDAIINSKIEEAARKQVAFIYRVRLPYPNINISPVDICAVLSNQLDNAIEACEALPAVESRFMTLDIWKREAFVFFKVVNSTNRDKQDKNRIFVSTKSSRDGMHGLGLKNIKETTEKYGGSLEMTCENGYFTSIAMLQETN